MVQDGCGDSLSVGDEVIVVCRVLAIRAGDDPLVRLEVRGTYAARRKEQDGMQTLQVQASACLMTRKPKARIGLRIKSA